MPVARYQLPDGRVARFEVPGGTTPEQAQAIGDAHFSAAQPEQAQQPEPNSAVDAIRSIPGGLAKGLSGIVGIPGDISHAMGVAGGFIRKNVFGEDPAAVDAAEAATDRKGLPTTGDVANAVAKPFGGYYQPQTMAGRYAETISSFAPAAAAPGGLATRVARVAIPGAASEAAGELPGVQGTSVEPYARAIAGMGAGVATGLGEGMLAERAQSRGVPSTAQVKASAGYDQFAQKPVTMTSEAKAALDDHVGQTAIRHALNEAQINQEPVLVRQFQRMLNPNPSRRPGYVTTEAADKIRQAFDSLAEAADTPNAARGWQGRSDAMETTIQQTPEINDARNAWSQFRKSQIIDKTMQRATDSAGTPAGFGDSAQAVRREFLKLTRSAKFQSFSPEEQGAIKAVANGNLTSNILQRVGKYSPVRSHLTGLAELGAGAAGHAPEAIAAAVGGELARQGSEFATARSARLASELVRSGGTTTPQMGRLAARNAVPTSLPRQSSHDDSYTSKIKSLASQ